MPHLGRVFEAEGRGAEAMRRYLASVEAGPAGAVEEAAGELDRVLKEEAVLRDVTVPERLRAWDVLVEATPETGRFAFDAAKWFRDAGKDPERARRHLDAALRAEPDNPEYDLLG